MGQRPKPSHRDSLFCIFAYVGRSGGNPSLNEQIERCQAFAFSRVPDAVVITRLFGTCRDRYLRDQVSQLLSISSLDGIVIYSRKAIGRSVAAEGLPNLAAAIGVEVFVVAEASSGRTVHASQAYELADYMRSELRGPAPGQTVAPFCTARAEAAGAQIGITVVVHLGTGPPSYPYAHCVVRVSGLSPNAFRTLGTNATRRPDRGCQR